MVVQIQAVQRNIANVLSLELSAPIGASVSPAIIGTTAFIQAIERSRAKSSIIHMKYPRSKRFSLKDRKRLLQHWNKVLRNENESWQLSNKRSE